VTRDDDIDGPRTVIARRDTSRPGARSGQDAGERSDGGDRADETRIFRRGPVPASDAPPANGASRRDDTGARLAPVAPPPEPLPAAVTRRRLLAELDRTIAGIDRLLSEQVNAILHHPRFQRLEATWRGLHYLVGVAEPMERVKVRALSITWNEVCRDLERAVEFDQSGLFELIYNAEFGSPGGEPYGLLVADYAVQHVRSAEHPTDDVAAVRALAQVAAAAFAPILLNASPVLLGIDSFRDLHAGLDLEGTFLQPDYARWRGLREEQDTRFVALTLPRVLMRRPLRHDGTRAAGFRFSETAAEVGHDGYLWGSASYAFAAVVMRAFAASGWFADIRGTIPDTLDGGLVVNLTVDDFATDRPGLATKMSTEVAIAERQEKDLSDHGLIPLMRSTLTDFSVFYGNQSLHRPPRYDRPAATANARLSAMLQYVLCVSRFAHFVKVLARERIGAFATPADCEAYLHRWLNGYCLDNDEAAAEVRARYPLREARVNVREHPGRPGSYACTVHLKPQFQLDQIVSEFRLVTELAPAQGA